jgi:hypothetical protein
LLKKGGVKKKRGRESGRKREEKREGVRFVP